MSLMDRLENAHTFNRRLDRGWLAWKWLFSKTFWENIYVALLVTVMSPLLVSTYLVGWIAEYWDNRKDGIKTVKG
jgi:hypothetical protein